MSFLEDKIISNQQLFFRSFHFTETSLFQVTKKYLLNIDKRLINGVLFLDVKKAFDAVNYKILFTKLKLYGIKELLISYSSLI